MATSSVILRLLIDTQAKTILFAEAGKDFVDFLFHILSLPMGTIVSLLREQEMVGLLENLYESMENLDDFETLSKPAATGSCIPLLGIKSSCPTRKKTGKKGKKKSDGKIVDGSDDECGSVKGVVTTYMVTDDLVVTSMSAKSSIIKLLEKFNVKDVGILEEKVVSLGMAEARKLLKASMEVRSVFTHVFLNSKE